MPRVFKRDPVATLERQFVDRDSYVSFRLHPGTDHPCIYLAGDDVLQARRRIFDRDKHKCSLRLVCKGIEILPFEGSIYDRGHLEHLNGGDGADRCWCDENLRLACYGCHVVKDGRQPRWSKL